MLPPPSPAAAVLSPARRALVLAVLLVVYSFNFLDRQILGILAPAIRRDLHLTDGQLGALGGIAFAMLYSTLGVPLALAADRAGRGRVVAASLALWSGFTALCGLATGFATLFACRVGVGLGEAGGVAPSYAIIADAFPPERRGRALAIYSLGVPLGLGAGGLLGGWIAERVDWHAAFVVLGLAGLAVAPLVWLLVRAPARRAATAAVPVAAVVPILAAKRSFWLLALAGSMSSLAGYGLAFWLPSVLVRSFSLGLGDAARFTGTLALVGGSAGVLGGGWLADRLGRADRGAFARVPALAWLLTVPLYAAGLLAHDVRLAWALLLLPSITNLVWLAPVTAAVQHLVPPPMRAGAGACFLFVNNLIGLGLGSWIMGAVSQALTARLGAEALRWACLGVLPAYLVAAALAWAAMRPLRREWVAG